MADPPKRPPAHTYRRKTPSFGGVEIPPRTGYEPPATSDAPTAEDRVISEKVVEIYNQLQAMRKELAAERGRDLQWRSSVEETLAEHREQINQLRDGALAMREMRQEVNEMTKQIGSLASDIRVIIRSDATQTVDMAKLEAKVIESVAGKTTQMANAAGTEAGANAGKTEVKKLAWPLILISVLGATAANLKACTELVKAAPFDPVTNPAELRQD